MALEEIIQKLDTIWRRRQSSKHLSEYLGALRKFGQGSDEEYLAYVKLIGINPDYHIFARHFRRQLREGKL